MNGGSSEPSCSRSEGDGPIERDDAAGAAATAAARLLSCHFLVGAGAGLVIVLLLLPGGSSSLLEPTRTGAMYDAQARALLDGRWDIPRSVSSIETFLAHGKSYIYFGPFPALLRMPVAAVTHRFDGRLGQVSILLATLLVISAATVIVYEVSRRASIEVSSAPLARNAVTIVGAVLTGGSILTYLAERGDVYNEAIIWGIATTLASLGLLIRAMRTNSVACVVAAGVFAAAAMQSRITLGVSATAAIMLVFVATLTRSTREASGIHEAFAGRRLRAVLLTATALPVATFVGVQLAKFGAVVVKPSQHVVNIGRPQFAAYVAQHGDSFFDVSFLPTNFLDMSLWPAEMDLTRSFPWLRPVDAAVGPTVGNPLFLGRSWTGSLGSTQTLLLAVAAVGTYATCGRWLRRKVPSTRRTGWQPAVDCRHVRPVALGASSGFVLTLAYSYQSHRFLGDAMPALVLLSVVGSVVLPAIAPTRMRSWAVQGVLVLLAGWSIWVNTSTALLAQTERAWNPSPAAVTRLLSLRDMFGSRPRITNVAPGEPLPAAAQVGDLLVIGDCDALLSAAGTDGFDPLWWPVELGPKFTRDLDIDLASLPVGETRVIDADVGGNESSIAVEVGATGSTDLVVRGFAQENRYALPRKKLRINLEFSPVWTGLTARFGDESTTVPWLEPLDAATFAGKPFTVEPPKALSTCNRIADR